MRFKHGSARRGHGRPPPCDDIDHAGRVSPVFRRQGVAIRDLTATAPPYVADHLCYVKRRQTL